MINILATEVESTLATAVESTTETYAFPEQTFTSFSIIGLLVMLVYFFIIGLVIVGLVRLVKYLGSAKKEQKLIRMELGKLAEEVHLIREGIKRK